MTTPSAAMAQHTPEQQAMIALQNEMQQMRGQMNLVSSRYDQLNNAHSALQVAHDQLRDDASRVLSERAEEIKQLERSIGSLLRKQNCDLLDIGTLKPTEFKGERSEKWRPWARKLKAYCNAKQSGFKRALEWAEAQTTEITDLSGCPWDRARDLDETLFDFLQQCLRGHAGLIVDRKELEGRGFEVWRRAHQTYAPVGAQYETDMLQALFSQGPVKDMQKLAEATTKFEHDWRKHEQESGDSISEKFKSAIILRMFPSHPYADALRREHQQGTTSYQQLIDHILAHSQYLRAENAFRRGDTDAMAVDSIESGWNDGGGDECTGEELKLFYMGFEDGILDKPASIDTESLERPLAAMYRKGHGKGKGKKGIGKGKTGSPNTYSLYESGYRQGRQQER